MDDTYNANPQSMRAAVSVLADSLGEWKVAVLGDMLELGPFSPALHSGVGRVSGPGLGSNALWRWERNRSILAQGARDSGVPLVYHCADKEAAKVVLEELIRPNSAFLVKASRGMKLEDLTAFLLEHTKEA